VVADVMREARDSAVGRSVLWALGTLMGCEVLGLDLARTVVVTAVTAVIAAAGS
jgi:hypothetical protein